jgi:hypothetical protein
MRNRLKTGLLAAGVAMALGGASGAYAGVTTHANDSVAPARLDNAVSVAGQAGHFEKTQFFWGGRNYCFYDSGWRGPGYYWCGYAWHRGYGWGGPMGWHGWGRDWHHDRDWHDRGYGRDWHHDRDWHDRGYDHGDRGDHHDWHDDHR